LGGVGGTRTLDTNGLLDLSVAKPANSVNNATPPLTGAAFVFQGVRRGAGGGLGAGGLIVATGHSLMTWSKPPARGHPARNWRRSSSVTSVRLPILRARSLPLRIAA